MLTNETDPIQVADTTVGGYKIRHLTHEADRGRWPWMGEYLADARWQHACWGVGGLFNGGTSHDKRDLQSATAPQPEPVDWKKPIRQRGEGRATVECIGDILSAGGPCKVIRETYQDGKQDVYTVSEQGIRYCGERHILDIINTPPEPECVRVSLGTRTACGSERIFLDIPHHKLVQVLDQYGLQVCSFTDDNRFTQAAKSYTIGEWHAATK